MNIRSKQPATMRVTLIEEERFEEAKALLHRAMPVAAARSRGFK